MQSVIGAGACLLLYGTAKPLCGVAVARLASVFAAISFPLLFAAAAIGHQAIDVFLTLLVVWLLVRQPLVPPVGVVAVGRTWRDRWDGDRRAGNDGLRCWRFSRSGSRLHLDSRTGADPVGRCWPSGSAPPRSCHRSSCPRWRRRRSGWSCGSTSTCCTAGKPTRCASVTSWSDRSPIRAPRSINFDSHPGSCWRRWGAPTRRTSAVQFLAQPYGGFDLAFLRKGTDFYYGLWFYAYALATAGAVIALVRIRRGGAGTAGLALILGVIASRTLPHVVLESNYRHRVPVEPYLILLASIAAVAVVTAIRPLDVATGGSVMTITRRKFLVFALISVVAVVIVMLSGALAADLYLHHRAERSAGLNRWGYRGPVAGRKQAGEVRFAMLGGSTAFGYGVRWDEAIPGLLETELRARYPQTTLDRPEPRLQHRGRVGVPPQPRRLLEPRLRHRHPVRGLQRSARRQGAQSSRGAAAVPDISRDRVLPDPAAGLSREGLFHEGRRRCRGRLCTPAARRAPDRVSSWHCDPHVGERA